MGVSSLAPRLSGAAILATAIAVVMAGGAVCEAGLLFPQAIAFDSEDLERALSEGDTGRTSSGRSDANTNWLSKGEERNDPSQPHKARTPSDGSSSSTSPPSPGGGASGGIAVCVFNSAIAIADDTSRGGLSDDYAFCLPDPPGTDLLRPPQT